MTDRKHSSGSKSGDRGREAGKATAAYRAKHHMPEGTQVQHWTKVLPSRAAGMSPDRYNRNLSPLQSRKDGAATTMLTSKDGTKGTTYSIHHDVNGKGELSEASKTYGTEHKFADQHLIPAEEKHIRQSNPNVDKQDLHEAAGASARHKMTGHPGDVSKHVAEHVNLAKGERIPKLPGGGQTANHGSHDVLKDGADRRATGEWNDAPGHDTRVRHGRVAGFRNRAGSNKSNAAADKRSVRSNSEPGEPRGSTKRAGTSGLRNGRVDGFQKRAGSAPSKNPPQRVSGQSASTQSRGGRTQGFQKPAPSTPSKHAKQQASGPSAATQNRGGRVQGFKLKATPAASSHHQVSDKTSSAGKTNSTSAAQSARFNGSQAVFKSVLKQNGGKSASQAKNAGPGPNNAGPRTAGGNAARAPSRGVAAPSRSGGGPRMGGGGKGR